MERKLAAILAADVAGYSRLMGVDEEGTLNALRSHREVVEGLIATHRGRVFNSAGDSIVAEFPSAVEAINCAVEIQQEMDERNEAVAKDRRLQFRIGINIGDIMAEGGDLFGDGVNVAARLQELAEPGGICAARNVYDQVKRKVGVAFEWLGQHRVKNIVEPVSAYRALIDGTRARSRARVQLTNLWHQRTTKITLLLFLLLAAGGGTAWHFYPQEQLSSGPPLVAVLPFVNMSGDPGQNDFSHALTDHIITVLSTWPEIQVVARTSTQRYEGATKDIREIATELGARYVIEGSLDKAADRVRITAQLIDGATGDHIWARPLDETGSDTVALTESVGNRLYAALAGFRGEFRRKEEELAWSEPEDRLQAYDYYLRGHTYFFRWSKEDNAHARQIWQQGLDRFPESALLRTKIAWTYVNDLAFGWSDDSKRDLEQAWTIGSRAAAAVGSSPLEQWYSHWLMALLYEWHDRNFNRSVAEAEAAAALNPYDAFSRSYLSRRLADAGKADKAIEWAKEAIRRDPDGPEAYIENLAWAYYLAGRPEEALAEIKKMSEPWGLNLAAVYVRLGRMEEAHATIADFVKSNPNYTLEVELRTTMLIEPLARAYADDLRKAGMVEK